MSTDTNSGPSEAKSTLTRDLAPNVSPADEAALVAGNNDFAFAAYKALAASNSNNQFFSPYSISSALAMTYAGASGATATEIAAALHFTLPQAALHPAFDAVDLALTADNDDASDASDSNSGTPKQEGKKLVLHVANSLWAAKDASFHQPFLDTLAVSYGAGVRLTDFAGNPEGSRTTINDWVSNETEDRINDLLPDGSISGSTRLVLVDAIYFNASWSSPFQASSTTPADFNRIDGSKVSAPTMHERIWSAYASTDSYDAIELPYLGNAVMDVVMPKAGTLSDFESKLDGAQFQTILAGFSHGDVDVSLPKFGYHGGTISLKSLLQGLGMKTAFESDADFSAMIDEPISIGDVVHKAFLAVDESGTEAAAATAVIMDAGASPGPSKPIPAITVDHPFMVVIRETTTGSILFAGRIGDPTAP